ncbi:cathepsin O-like [Agrilus planipennis]|uniref:Cathepsin O-like n=1 Tax=Agrilus planipennis TaxID=224129 RepID=A0A7F5RL94_AGRPL|nr:cathepsin O-like [Agrilus planipennis]
MTNLSKSSLGVIVFVLICFGVLLRVNWINSQVENLEEKFQNYLQKFHKNYSNINEYQRRLVIFRNALEEIEVLNSKRKSNRSAIYGLTQYSDFTREEFLQMTLTNYKSLVQNAEIQKPNQPFVFRRKRVPVGKLPLKVDWRNKTFVSDVKSQRSCGACWAFSVIAVVESMNCLKHNKSEILSIQQMIDCSKYGNRGCLGGDMCTLLQWLTDNNVAIELEEHYPLQLQNEQCKMNRNGSGVVVDHYICRSFADNEEMILKLLATHGPIAVSINALTWQNYIGGVIQFHCSSSLKYMNHAVQLVGYDLSDEIPHYIAKNSWGKTFGNNGYLYIAVGGNLCGLANEVVALSVV